MPEAKTRSPQGVSVVALFAVFVALTLLAVAVTVWTHHITQSGDVTAALSDDASLVVATPSLWPPTLQRPLRKAVDIEAIERPRLEPIRGVNLPGSTEVVGVTMSGQAYAFVVDAMDAPDSHIVNLVADSQRVSVTYCSLADCVRVLSGDVSQPSPRVGGFDVDFKMVYLIGGQRYSLQSKELPLADFSHTRTSLREWKSEHPNTLIYRGGVVPKAAS